MPRVDADAGCDAELDAYNATENEAPAVSGRRPGLTPAAVRRTSGILSRPTYRWSDVALTMRRRQ